MSRRGVRHLYDPRPDRVWSAPTGVPAPRSTSPKGASPAPSASPAPYRSSASITPAQHEANAPVPLPPVPAEAPPRISEAPPQIVAAPRRPWTPPGATAHVAAPVVHRPPVEELRLESLPARYPAVHYPPVHHPPVHYPQEWTEQEVFDEPGPLPAPSAPRAMVRDHMRRLEEQEHTRKQPLWATAGLPTAALLLAMGSFYWLTTLRGQLALQESTTARLAAEGHRLTDELRAKMAGTTPADSVIEPSAADSAIGLSPAVSTSYRPSSTVLRANGPQEGSPLLLTNAATMPPPGALSGASVVKPAAATPSMATPSQFAPVPQAVQQPASSATAGSSVAGSSTLIASHVSTPAASPSEDPPPALVASVLDSSSRSGLEGILAGAGSRPNVVPPAPKRPLVVSSGVMAARKLSGQNPLYPVTARAASVQGKVVLAAQISTAGRIENLQVLSGPIPLRQAALDAVKTWRYQPYMLDGEPIQVGATINVVFSLDH